MPGFVDISVQGFMLGKDEDERKLFNIFLRIGKLSQKRNESAWTNVDAWCFVLEWN